MVRLAPKRQREIMAFEAKSCNGISSKQCRVGRCEFLNLPSFDSQQPIILQSWSCRGLPIVTVNVWIKAPSTSFARAAPRCGCGGTVWRLAQMKILGPKTLATTRLARESNAHFKKSHLRHTSPLAVVADEMESLVALKTSGRLRQIPFCSVVRSVPMRERISQWVKGFLF